MRHTQSTIHSTPLHTKRTHTFRILVSLLAIISTLGLYSPRIHATFITNNHTIIVDHVIHVSIDGLAGRRLQALIAANPGQYAAFEHFIAHGATTFNARIDTTNSFTNPNHASILTGRPVSQPDGLPDTTHHGLITNFNFTTLHADGNPSLSYVTSVFDVVHDHGYSTGMYSNKSKFSGFANSYNEDNGRPDTIGADNGRNKIDKSIITFNSNSLVDFYLTDMAAHHFNYSFVHFANPDVAGHGSGWNSVVWDESVLEVDGYLQRIINIVNGDPILNGNTAIVVTADHGGGGDDPDENTEHNDPDDLRVASVPFMVLAPDLPGLTDAHDLFANRVDPGDLIPSYTDPDQPLRNGDSGNFALQLLGLPMIEGSFMQPGAIPEPGSFSLLLMLAGIFAMHVRRTENGSVL